jgi:hypothetical protein
MDKVWKQAERAVAGLLGGHRTPLSGAAGGAGGTTGPCRSWARRAMPGGRIRDSQPAGVPARRWAGWSGSGPPAGCGASPVWRAMRHAAAVRTPPFGRVRLRRGIWTPMVRTRTRYRHVVLGTWSLARTLRHRGSRGGGSPSCVGPSRAVAAEDPLGGWGPPAGGTSSACCPGRPRAARRSARRSFFAAQAGPGPSGAGPAEVGEVGEVVEPVEVSEPAEPSRPCLSRRSRARWRAEQVALQYFAGRAL